jgi:hypothetical protein
MEVHEAFLVVVAGEIPPVWWEHAGVLVNRWDDHIPGSLLNTERV